MPAAPWPVNDDLMLCGQRIEHFPERLIHMFPPLQPAVARRKKPLCNQLSIDFPVSFCYAESAAAADAIPKGRTDMIDNIRAGQNIAAHRLRMNWTQGELASRLNVTHQAVSKWENGVAFPDINTLFALSRLFEVSMEQLLTGENTQAEPVTATQPAEEAIDSVETADKSSAGSSDDDSDESTSLPYDWNEIIGLAPFASRETLDRLIDDHLEDCTADHIAALAPFLSHATLDRLIRSNLDHADWDEILSLAPFASRDTLDALVASCEASCDRAHLTALAPFLGHSTLDRLIRSNLDHADWDEILSLAPFASRDTLDALVASYEASCDRAHLTALAPFLSRQTLDRLILGGRQKKTDQAAERPSDCRTEKNGKHIETAGRWSEIHEHEMDRAARRAERHAERMAEQLEKRLCKQAEKAAQKAEETAKTLFHNRCSDAQCAFTALSEDHWVKETVDEPTLSAQCTPDKRRTQIVQPDPQAVSLEAYAERIVSLLYEALDADEPFCEQLEDLRNALLYKDYPALNEFAALLDAHIGPQWLEEYAVLCDQTTAPDEDFSQHLELALAQRDWSWIEDHAHLISDSEMIRRIILVSSTEGFFDFVPLFIDQLDQHSIDSAACQAIRLNRTDDILSFSDRVSPGILR